MSDDAHTVETDFSEKEQPEKPDILGGLMTGLMTGEMPPDIGILLDRFIDSLDKIDAIYEHLGLSDVQTDNGNSD